MELTLDIFKNDAFSFAALQKVVDNKPFTPQKLGQMGIFTPKPLMGTDKVIIYEEDGNVKLIGLSERGAPEETQTREQGRMFALQCKRVAKKDSVRGSELLSIADMALPERVRMRNAARLLDQRTGQLKSELEKTKEYMRLAAIQGKFLDPRDNSVVFDFWDVFGKIMAATVTINFAALTEDDFQMYVQETFLVPMQLALKDRWVDGVTEVGCLVGDSGWKKLMTHPAFREVWKLQMQAQLQANIVAGANGMITRPNNWQEISLFGVRWMNYRGSTTGDIAIPANAFKFFPIGATDAFCAYWAPGETLAQVAEEGRPEYLIVRPDVRADPEFVDVSVRSYPLYACLAPQALMSAVHA